MTPMRLRVLIVTNLFANPWDASRATFNQQQFERLSRTLDISVLVPVSWLSVLRRPLAYPRLRHAAMRRWPFVNYVIFWYVPGVGRRFHAAFLLVSLLLQRLPTFLFRRWSCILASWAYPDAVAVGALALMSRTPFVVKVHGTDINGFAEAPARRTQIRWALNRAHHVIAVSQALAHRLGEIGVSRERTSVLYNGVDPRKFHPIARDEARRGLGYAAGDGLVLFVGNVQTSKGCAELLEAFLNLSASTSGLRLAFAGSGPQVKALQAIVRDRGMTQEVRFLGRLAHGDLLQWFGAASLLCLPSHAEGVPNVVLEAMACGTPVVASDVGGIAEVLPPFAGLLVPARNVDALQMALASALSTDWDTDRIVRHASGFDWDRNVARLGALLQDAALAARRPS